MRLRTDISPKCPRDALITYFMCVFLPIVYYFHVFVLLPVFYEPWNGSYKIHFVLSTLLLINVFANLLATIFVDTSIKGLVLPLDSKSDWRYCSVCESSVPPRTWHCKICKICILQRDHHCMFTSCCIGFENHRYFIIFLLYLQISSIYCTYFNYYYVSQYIMTDYSIKSILKIIFPICSLFYEWDKNFLTILLMKLVFVGGFCIAILLHHHLTLTLKNLVTHDKDPKSKYDRGRLGNLKVVFGKRWYLVWIAPWIESKLPCDGINWDMRFEKEKK